MATDNHICQIGKPKGMRIIIATGEVNGIIDSQTAKEPFGALIMPCPNSKQISSGAVSSKINC